MPQVERRRLLRGAAAASIIAMTTEPALAAAAKGRFFERIGKPIGLQLYTLGEEPARDLDATLAQVARIGFREIEISSLFGRSAAQMRAAADKAGLAITSMHLMVSTQGLAPGLSLSSPPAEIAETLGVLGAKYAGPPIALFPEGFRPKMDANIQAAIGEAFAAAGADPWKRTAALLNERGAVLKPLGVNLTYHNHNLEFGPIGGATGWDILLAELDPALVYFELDVGWVAAAGRDPVAVLNSIRGRVRQLHVKDVEAGNTVNFALAMKPAEIGAGTLDWARILPAARAAGVEHYYVEQEPPFAIPRIEAVRRDYAYLSAFRA